MASRRVPRASISVTTLRDPDVIMLRKRGPSGRAAWGDFISLIILARDLENGGEFQEPINIVASLIQLSTNTLTTSIRLITNICAKSNHEPWLILSNDGLITIRNYVKWNKLGDNWGGPRPRSGRPKKNQDESSPESSWNHLGTPPQRGNGNGEDSSPEGESEGGFAADLEILRAAGPDDEITSGDRYTAKPIASGIWSALPERVQVAEPSFVEEFIRAIRRGFDPDELESKLAAYYASPEGQGTRWKQPGNFLRERLTDNPSAWGSRTEQISASDDAAENAIERTRRRLAEMRGDSTPPGATAP